ncbi:hypothetical protein H6P81_004139 [Aristolochia fimbriata]|uniref:Uncharacterized protein n=1 Tax=Aristolochia fimbriata TaxID=158543 RepID=A0AAV7FHK2_ARIFI|nr:hypothetical protein H6P81_004139 [Aristolochia fimbriata]
MVLILRKPQKVYRERHIKEREAKGKLRNVYTTPRGKRQKLKNETNTSNYAVVPRRGNQLNRTVRSPQQIAEREDEMKANKGREEKARGTEVKRVQEEKQKTADQSQEREENEFVREHRKRERDRARQKQSEERKEKLALRSQDENFYVVALWVASLSRIKIAIRAVLPAHQSRLRRIGLFSVYEAQKRGVG